MRRWLWVLFSMLPITAAASTIEYTFTGTMSLGSTLTKADGTAVDLSLAPFTVVGVTTGIDPLWELNEYTTDMAVFSAVSTYDFGALGSITATDQYVERFATTASGRTVQEIGLMSWWPGTNDLIGFMVGVTSTLDVPMSATPDPTAIGAFTTQYTLSNSHTRYLSGDDGSTFQLQRPIFTITLDITSGSAWATNAAMTESLTADVPEPSTLWLLGAGAVLLRRRHRASPRSTESHGS
ncbi:MAG: PEP-CTERM sorting domain-containing protein [Vicinamibacterales bacterium]